MGIFSKIKNIFAPQKLDSATLESLTDALIGADIAPNLADEIIRNLRSRFRPDSQTSESEIKQALADILRPITEKITTINSENNTSEKTHIILVIGVNGAGKTTTIGKLAAKLGNQGKKVIIGSCDTFRAAAFDQLDWWAKTAGAKIICGDRDPATTAFKTIETANNENADIVILDTAGRLHNRADLMEELSKIIRVIKKIMPDAPHETLLVLDANNGQNALNQIEFFDKVAPLSGLIITKMDSTSKGGFLISYASANKNPLPVYAVGCGEKIDDLKDFDAQEYLRKLLDL